MTKKPAKQYHEENSTRLEREYNELPDDYRSRVLPLSTVLYAVLLKQNELRRKLGSNRIRISEVTPLQHQRFRRHLEVKKELQRNTVDLVNALDGLLGALPADDATQAFRDFIQRMLRSARERVATLVEETVAMEVKLTEQGNSDKTELEIRQEQYGMGLAWVGAWHFATDGSFGKTSLWVKQNASARVIDVSTISPLK